MRAAKFNNPALMTEAKRMQGLGFCAAAVGQALGVSKRTVERIAMAAGIESFGARRLPPRMIRPLGWLNDPSKIPENVRPVVVKIIKAMEGRTDWPLQALTIVYPGVGLAMMTKWCKWHTEAQIARGQITLEIQRVAEGKPLRKKRRVRQYRKHLHYVRFDELTKTWYAVPNQTESMDLDFAGALRGSS